MFSGSSASRLPLGLSRLNLSGEQGFSSDGPSTSGSSSTATPSSIPSSSGNVSMLSENARQELATAIIKSFKNDPDGTASVLARTLNDKSRQRLVSALQQCQSNAGLKLSRQIMAAEQEMANSGPDPAQPPTMRQLTRVAITKGLPFVAFGFFDNVIMITAGEQIDMLFGAKLGLSAMMAAGLGNTIADVVGINISHSIEQRFKQVPWIMASPLTAAQAVMRQTKRARWLGCAIGMTTGCLLGLLPLAFLEAQEGHSPQKERAHLSGADAAGAAAAPC